MRTRKFDIGQKVRFKQKTYERTGTVLEVVEDKVMVGVGEPHYFTYKEQLFSPNELYVFHELSDEDAHVFWSGDFPRAFEYAKKIFSQFCPDSVLEFDENDLIIRDTRTGIYLGGVIMEKRTIGSIIEFAGYGVFAETLIPGCRTMPNGDPGYPDEVDVIDLGTYNTYSAAVIGMAKEVFAANIEIFLEREHEEMMAQSYAEDFEYDYRSEK